MLATPSTFTASIVAAIENPEPASLFLVLIAGLAGLGLARARRSFPGKPVTSFPAPGRESYL
ncbi:MAG: PEP-CTERM sorting domain-containing protein [Verrucomicrobia bacterium]|nr:PEP-CTERM sorting domain-containing protein [Verrucomicrobiota bacterium]